MQVPYWGLIVFCSSQVAKEIIRLVELKGVVLIKYFPLLKILERDARHIFV